MNELAELQQRFLDYLLHADNSIEGDISGRNGTERQRRLSIYYNAYRVRLRGSIETDHPMLGLYLGDRWFDELVDGYIAAHPSSVTSLRYFCDSLPDYLATARPFAERGELAELARFERLLMAAFDAADAARASAECLQSIQPGDWPTLVVPLHPSVRFFHPRWNVVEIWRALKNGERPPLPVEGSGSGWIVWRDRNRVTAFRSLEPDEEALLDLARRGARFSTLCERLLDWRCEIDVAPRALKLLQGWIDQGIVCDWQGRSTGLSEA